MLGNLWPGPNGFLKIKDYLAEQLTITVNAAMALFQGGSQTLESLYQELLQQLDLARSPDSGTLSTGAGAETAMYSESDATPFFFAGGAVDLQNMGVGDTCIIRVYKQISPTGALEKAIETTYNDVQDPNLVLIDGFYAQYGVEVTLEHSVQAVAGIDIYHEWFDAKRGG